jgi:two-component system, OmpR family, sensor histidine kinase KdpD
MTEKVTGRRAETSTDGPNGAKVRILIKTYTLRCLLSLGLVVAATVVGLAIRSFVHLTIIVLLYVTAVLVSAAASGLIPSLVAAVASALALDFFFVLPFYTLWIADPEDILSVLFFSIVAAFISGLASRLRYQMLLARDREKITADLYSFSRKLTGIVSLADLLAATEAQVASMLEADAVVLLGEDDQLAERVCHPIGARIDELELAALRCAWRSNRLAGRGPFTVAASNWLLVPISTARGPVGVLAIRWCHPATLITTEERRFVLTVAELTGIAVERLFLAEEIDQARLAREADRLKSTLLNSIAHDLRTPVTTMLGALSSLQSDFQQFDPHTRSELLDIAQGEAERLERFVDSLLTMTRLEAGILEMKREPVDLADVVGSAMRRVQKNMGSQRVKISLPSDLPMVALDFVLFEQVLYNLLDNAAKYCPDTSSICVKGERCADTIVLSVSDEGCGIPQSDLERVFEKFFRGTARGGHRQEGIGLGLAICRGFIEALGGTITAGNRMDRPGAVFTIRLPCEQRDPATVVSLES